MNDVPVIIEDPVLGRLTWEKVYGRWTWTFAVPLTSGNAARAYTLPDAGWEPPGGESLHRIRALVEWLGGNEPSLRAHVAAEMLEQWRADYWDPGTDGPATAERLAARLRLVEVTFVPDGLAYLWYDFDAAAGPGQIRLGLDSTGAVAIKPGYAW
jgi:hypothetical protein